MPRSCSVRCRAAPSRPSPRPTSAARFKEAIDRLDAEGIPGEVEPGELKSGLEAAGIDLDQIGASLGDLASSPRATPRSNLTGAVVLTTTNADEANNTVANIGLLLRATGTPGVTALSGKLSGFSVRSPELGDKPLVVAAEGDRIAVAYGLAAAAAGSEREPGRHAGRQPRLQGSRRRARRHADQRLHRRARRAAVRHRPDLRHDEQSEGFEEAKPYLEKIAYVAIGSGTSDDGRRRS